jgi:hypothetical protein
MKYLFLSMVIFLSGCLKEDVDIKTLPIQIEQPYAFATLPGTATGAAFMAIKNSGEADRLIGAKSKVSEITEIHENLIDPDDGTMMMRKIRGIDIPPNNEIALKPTGYHIMFIRMKEPLTMGQTTPLTLTFEKAGDVEVEVAIIAPGTKP